MSSRHLIPTTVISGFPAIGKSTLAKNRPGDVLDLESSDYHWAKDANGDFIVDDEGTKTANPEWPMNYIQAIKDFDAGGRYIAILVSSHEEIRTLMGEAGIKYTNICPEDTSDMHNIICARCVERRSPAKFISDLDKNWSNYVQSMINDPAATRVVQLNPTFLTQWDGWAVMR